MTAYETKTRFGDNRAALSIRELLTDAHADIANEVDKLVIDAGKLPSKITDNVVLAQVGAVIKRGREIMRKAETAKKVEKEPWLTGGREVDGFFRELTDKIERAAQSLQRAADQYQREKAEAERKRLAEEARKKREEEERLRAEQERQAEIARKAEEANRTKTAEKADEKARVAEVQANLAAADAVDAEMRANASAAALTKTTLEGGLQASARAPWVHQIEDIAAVDLEALRPYLKREHIDAAIRAAIRVGVRGLRGVRIYQDIKANFR